MATIDNLNKSISQMSDEELLDLLRGIRASRRKHKIVESKSRVRPERKASVIDLSQAAMETLIHELEETMR